MQFQELQDSFFNAATRERISKLEMSYQLKVREAENLELTKRQAQQGIILRQRTLIAIATGLIAILLVLLVIRQYRTNQVKAELNRQLEDTVQKRTAALKAANEQLRIVRGIYFLSLLSSLFYHFVIDVGIVFTDFI